MTQAEVGMKHSDMYSIELVIILKLLKLILKINMQLSRFKCIMV